MILDLAKDLDGPYQILQGISAIFQTLATLTFAAVFPFPRQSSTYG